MYRSVSVSSAVASSARGFRRRHIDLYIVCCHIRSHGSFSSGAGLQCQCTCLVMALSQQACSMTSCDHAFLPIAGGLACQECIGARMVNPPGLQKELTAEVSWCSYLRVGSVIMLLHDASDILMELAKMMQYLKAETASVVTFAAFMISWVVLRLGILPFIIIPSAWYVILAWSLWRLPCPSRAVASSHKMTIQGL